MSDTVKETLTQAEVQTRLRALAERALGDKLFRGRAAVEGQLEAILLDEQGYGFSPEECAFMIGWLESLRDDNGDISDYTLKRVLKEALGAGGPGI